VGVSSERNMGIIDGIVGLPQKIDVIRPLLAWRHTKGEWFIRYPARSDWFRSVRGDVHGLASLSAV
jgi:hypothetical protein